MKKIIFIQSALSAAGAVLLATLDAQQSALSYLLGAMIVLANLVSHAFVWGRLFRKKLIALATLIIVFKYAILGIIIYKILKVPWISPLWFCVGISSLLLSSVIFAVLKEDHVI